MDLIITGTLKGVSQVTQGTSQSGNTWRKCEVVVAEDREYGNSVCATAFNDKVDQLGNLTAGMQVTMHFNCKTRTYNGKVYNDINLWKIEQVGQPQQVASVSPAPQPAAAPQPVKDDLPF